MKSGPERALVDDYLARTRRLARQVGWRAIEETELAAGPDREAEGERLLARLADGANGFRLDERGEPLTSTSLSDRLASLRDQGTADVAFLIGGAEGFSGAVRQAVPRAIAFGVQTWPHRLVRAMLAEQLYRAATLQAGLPYHKA